MSFDINEVTTENYVGALVEVEISPEYIVRLRVKEHTGNTLSSSSSHHVAIRGKRVTVIEPAPIPEPLNGEVWRSTYEPSHTYTWDVRDTLWRGSLKAHTTESHPSEFGYVKIAEGVA